MASVHPTAEPPGWLTRFRRGVIAGLSIPLIGLMLLAIPVMLAWIAPSANTVSASSAIRAAALALLSAMRGGLVLNGQLTTLAPLTVTILLGWLLCGPARRMDSTSGFVGVITGFTLCCTAMAHWSRLGTSYAPGLRTMLASLLFAVLVGSVARWSEPAWRRSSDRARLIARTVAALGLCYSCAAAVLIAVMLGVHHGQAAALQGAVAPGDGGLAMLLLGIAAAPTAVVSAVGYLVGPGFGVGAHTSVSAFATSRGLIPDFPLLAALPGSQRLSVLGLVVVVLTALAAGAVVVGRVRPLGRGWNGVTDLATTSAGFGLLLLMLAELARGGIGGGALRGIGPSGWQVAGAGLAVTLLSSLICTGVVAGVSRLRPAAPHAEPVRLGAVAEVPVEAEDPADDAVPSAEPPPADATVIDLRGTG
jgi:Family of unknown function (DUF6350)